MPLPIAKLSVVNGFFVLLETQFLRFVKFHQVDALTTLLVLFVKISNQFLRYAGAAHHRSYVGLLQVLPTVIIRLVVGFLVYSDLVATRDPTFDLRLVGHRRFYIKLLIRLMRLRRKFQAPNGRQKSRAIRKVRWWTPPR